MLFRSDQLPAIVRKTLEERFPEAEIDEVSMIENSTMIFFEIELETENDREITVRIKDDGMILP